MGAVVQSLCTVHTYNHVQNADTSDKCQTDLSQCFGCLDARLVAPVLYLLLYFHINRISTDLSCTNMGLLCIVISLL